MQAIGSLTSVDVDTLSAQMSALAANESTPTTLPRDVIDAHLLPRMRIEDVFAYGRTDCRGANAALIEVRKRGYSWLQASETRVDFEAAKHLHNVRIAVRCGQERLFVFLTRPFSCLESRVEFAIREPLLECKTLEEVLCKKDSISRISTIRLLTLYTSTTPPVILPPELGEFTGLTRLICYDISLKMVPVAVAVLLKCTQLQELDLISNKLTTIPPELGKCPNLQSLGLVRNELITLPRELNECKTLRTIKAQGNPLDEQFVEFMDDLFPSIHIVTKFPGYTGDYSDDSSDSWSDDW